jgi:hypothetical protein
MIYRLIRDSPQPISPRNKVAQLYPRALGSLYVASCDSQGYGGGIVTFPQPGGPGSRNYISQERGGPVIPTGTGFALRRLLRLAGLRWRYCNLPPTWRARSTYIYPSGTGWSCPKSKSKPCVPVHVIRCLQNGWTAERANLYRV